MTEDVAVFEEIKCVNKLIQLLLVYVIWYTTIILLDYRNKTLRCHECITVYVSEQ
jgi:hypothetical protein